MAGFCRAAMRRAEKSSVLFRMTSRRISHRPLRTTLRLAKHSTNKRRRSHFAAREKTHAERRLSHPRVAGSKHSQFQIVPVLQALPLYSVHCCAEVWQPRHNAIICFKQPHATIEILSDQPLIAATNNFSSLRILTLVPPRKTKNELVANLGNMLLPY
jgi:hypothetical protein